MGISYNPKAVADSLLLSLDIDNSKNYNAGLINSSATNYTFTAANSPTYVSVSNGEMTFTRAASVTTKGTNGGGIYVDASGSLAVSSFLYNDFTWEIWVKINDYNPSNYDATEAQSALAVFCGFHAGFVYTNSALYFSVWDSTTSSKLGATWTTSEVPVGIWKQIVVVRSGNVFTPYLNGILGGTGYTQTTSNTGIGTGNRISIGSAYSGPSANYLFYSKSTFSNMKMYNRALTAAEVQQNYNALRGRFGI